MSVMHTEHLRVLRRQILKLTAGPTTQDELIEGLPLVGDERSIQEAREQVEFLVGLGYLRGWQYEGVAWLQRTETGTRQITRATTELDPAIWGGAAFRRQ